MWLAPFQGLNIGVSAAVVSSIGVYGAVMLWLAGRTPDGTTARVPNVFNLHNLPVDQRRTIVRRQLILGALVWPAASAWIAFDIGRLESGAVEHVDLWAPIAFLYEHLGYWAAVMAMPIAGALLSAALLKRLRREH